MDSTLIFSKTPRSATTAYNDYMQGLDGFGEKDPEQRGIWETKKHHKKIVGWEFLLNMNRNERWWLFEGELSRQFLDPTPWWTKWRPTIYSNLWSTGPPNYLIFTDSTVTLGEGFTGRLRFTNHWGGWEIVAWSLDPDFFFHRRFCGCQHVWAIYNDLSRGHPKWWFSKGIPPKMALN